MKLLEHGVRTWAFIPADSEPQHPWRDPGLVAAIRRAFPRGPTLADVLAARR